MDGEVRKPFGLDSPECSLLLLFQVLVALLANVPAVPDGRLLVTKLKFLNSLYPRIQLKFRNRKASVGNGRVEQNRLRGNIT